MTVILEAFALLALATLAAYAWINLFVDLATSSETSPRSAVSRAVSAPDTPQTAHEVAGVSLVSLDAVSPGTDGHGSQAASKNDEPTDDDIYNGHGMEGGIAYTTDEPGSLGENDWRL